MRQIQELTALRGLAVFCVVVGHVLPQNPVSGFVGVDIFLVLSGFLICKTLLNDVDRVNKVGNRRNTMVVVGRFYFKRVRRIAPLSVVGVFAVVLYSYIFLGAEKGAIAFREGIPAVLGFENIYLLVNKSNYFSDAQFSYLFSHYWSLALEVQFYLLFPLVFWLCQTLVSRGYASKRYSTIKLFFLTMSIATFSSFACFIYLGISGSPQLYFHPFSRFWEIGIGILLVLSRENGVFWRGISPKGASLLFTVFFTISLALTLASSRFQEVAILLAAFSTFIFISGVTDDKSQQYAGSAFLGKTFFAQLGLISYSVFIWYLPLSVFRENKSGFSDLSSLLKYFAMLVFISGLSYFLIEKTFNSWPLPRLLRSWQSTKEFLKHTRDANLRGSQFLATVLVMTLIMTPIFITMRFLIPTSNVGESNRLNLNQKTFQSIIPSESLSVFDGESTIPQGRASNSLSSPDSKVQKNNPIPRWHLVLQDSFLRDRLPFDLQGNLRSSLGVSNSVISECNQLYFRSVGCSVGEIEFERKALIIGDSHAAEIIEPLFSIFAKKGWFVQALNRSGCNIGSRDLPVQTDGSVDYNCDLHRTWVANQIKLIKPELLIVSENSSFDEVTEKALKLLSEYSDQTLYLSFRMGSKNLLDCLDAKFSLSPCIVNPKWADQQEKRIQSRLGVLEIDSLSRRDWLCYRDNCPPVVDEVPVYFDGVHFTPAFARLIEPILSYQLRTKIFER